MIVKVAAALLALFLFVIYSGAIVLKLKEVALAVVILIGLVMMVVDLYQSLKNGDH